MTWKVIPGCDEDVFEDQRKEEMKKIYDLISPILDEEGEDNLNNNNFTIFWKLWPEDIETKWGKLNSAIVDDNASNKESYKRVIRHVSRSANLIFRALIIGSTVHFQQGEKLWLTTLLTRNEKREEDQVKL